MNVSRSTLLATALLLAGLPAFAAEAPNTRSLPSGPFRSADGSGNNVANPKWGAAGGLLLNASALGTTGTTPPPPPPKASPAASSGFFGAILDAIKGFLDHAADVKAVQDHSDGTDVTHVDGHRC